MVQTSCVDCNKICFGKRCRDCHVKKYLIPKAVLFKKGHTPWDTGRKFTKKHRENISKAMKGRVVEANRGENNYRWTGNNISYKALHLWVKKYKIKTDKCENCNKKRFLELANISGEYKRDINDWKYFCRKCHRKYDKDRIRKGGYRAKDYFRISGRTWGY